VGYHIYVTSSMENNNIKNNNNSQQIIIRPASFRETCQWVIFPLNVLRAQSRVSPVVGLLTLASGSTCLKRMPRNRSPRVLKHYSPNGRRNHGRHLKRLMDTWDRNGSTSGPTPWKIYDDDEETILDNGQK
jgi:hypothetical protein